MDKQAHRKDEHVFIAEKFYQAKAQNDLQQVKLLVTNLPELSLADVDLSSNFLGHKQAYPFFINAMTGGSPQTGKINAKLATVAAKTGLAMAVGSQSIALKLPESEPTFTTVRQANPAGFILANLGAHHNLTNAKKAVALLDADALELHINLAQELVMPEGDRSFYWLDNIREIVTNLDKPVLVKEVGAGISPRSLPLLKKAGVKYLDLGGFGGTDFVAIENERRQNKELGYFNELSLSTAQSLLGAKKFQADFSFTATGGIRTALDIIKCLVLGADNVGIAGHFLHILLRQGEDALIAEINALKDQLRKLMVMLGCQTVTDLRSVPYILSPELESFNRQIDQLPFN